MKIVIDYNPTTSEIEKALRKAHTSAIRARYSLLADHEIKKTNEAIDRAIASAKLSGEPLELEVAKVFTQYGPDSLTSDEGE